MYEANCKPYTLVSPSVSKSIQNVITILSYIFLQINKSTNQQFWLTKPHFGMISKWDFSSALDLWGHKMSRGSYQKTTHVLFPIINIYNTVQSPPFDLLF